MKILVTGGAGFIGSNFIYYLLNKYPDYQIVCIDALTYAGNLSTLDEALQNSNFKFYKLNICIRQITRLPKKVSPPDRGGES